MAQRPKELTPNASPRHFFGAELRSRRGKRSLADLGRALHCDASYLARVEKADRSMSRELAEACDRELNAGGVLLRLHAFAEGAEAEQHVSGNEAGGNGLHVASSPLHVAKPADLMALDMTAAPSLEEGEDITVPARTPDGKVIFVSVSRRAFLQSAGAGLGVAALGDTGTGLPSSPRSLPRRSTAPDLNPVEHFDQMRMVLIENDNLFGPARVIRTVLDQIETIQHLREGSSRADQRALLQVQTKYAEFAGWLLQDVGDHGKAQYWTDRALEWSHRAGDPELTVYVLARKSQLAGDMSNALDAVDVAEAAESMARPRSRLAAVAATYAGHGYALEGDHEATMRTYDHALDLLDRMEPDPTSPWGVWLDRPYIDVARCRSLALLGEYRQAAEGFETAIAALPPGYHRDKGVYLSRAALAYAGSAEIERAAELGLRALDIGVDTNSARILTSLTQLETTLSHSSTPVAKEFREAISGSLARQV
ncbi:helix-turn-helix domain-containing protein [Amycolatopsis sp. NPDC059021]|uniref:helix-turn-helix domain-containing protein n=1 Tax=Amycolatopsis sp. NPDC059021 TaxID=3346704 RepID=UPI00366CB05E